MAALACRIWSWLEVSVAHLIGYFCFSKGKTNFLTTFLKYNGVKFFPFVKETIYVQEWINSRVFIIFLKIGTYRHLGFDVFPQRNEKKKTK